MHAARRWSAAIALGCWILGATCGDGVWADETEIFVSSAMVKPNVLLILDNSNSMDQDFLGNSVTSWEVMELSPSSQKSQSALAWAMEKLRAAAKSSLQVNS